MFHSPAMTIIREKHDAAPKADQLPGPHAVQDVLPSTDAYFPATQFAQVSWLLAPAVEECEPFGQEVHCTEPLDAEYVPAGQAVQLKDAKTCPANEPARKSRAFRRVLCSC